jgi:hypothetical protein
MGKRKHFKFIIPKWIKKEVQDNLDDFLKDTVYNVYECNCFLINEFDKKRTNRTKQSGRPGQSRFVCDCEKQGRFICKIKVCSICNDIIVSKKLKNGICNGCSMDKRAEQKIKRDMVFYQNKTIIDTLPQKPTYTEPYCKFRRECLSDIITLPEREFEVHLWCYGCSKFIDWRKE